MLPRVPSYPTLPYLHVTWTENTRVAMTTVMAMQHTGILAFRQTELKLHTSSLQECLTWYRVGCYPIVCVNKALSWLWLLIVDRQKTVCLIIQVSLTVQNWSGGKIRRCLLVLILTLAQLLTQTVSKSVGNGANLVTGKLKLLFEIKKIIEIVLFHNTSVLCHWENRSSYKVHPGKNQRYQ